MVSLPTREDLFFDFIKEGDMVRPRQVSNLPISATQAATLPLVADTTAQQLDITNIMNLMLPMMIMVMMMGMMSKAMASA